MWINGLKLLRKPIAHLHTQHNRDIPWSSIDMDFMNLNQAAHGDREHGFIMSRMRLNRKVVVGFWQEPAVQQKLGAWARAAAAWHDWQGAKFAASATTCAKWPSPKATRWPPKCKFGYSVNGYGVGDLVKSRQRRSGPGHRRALSPNTRHATRSRRPAQRRRAAHKSVREAARIELGLRAFLTAGGFKGFTTTFEDLHGLVQLPGHSRRSA